MIDQEWFNERYRLRRLQEEAAIAAKVCEQCAGELEKTDRTYTPNAHFPVDLYKCSNDHSIKLFTITGAWFND